MYDKGGKEEIKGEQYSLLSGMRRTESEDCLG
jgi:hypothetical protein